MVVPERETLGELVDVRRADRVVFQDAWVGYHADSPLCAVYDLRRSPAGGLVGAATFTANGRRTRRLRIAMRSGTAQTFLGTLAGAELVLRPYVPSRLTTDDYPTLDIFLQVPLLAVGDGGGCAHLHSSSQGAAHAPWAVSIVGRTYVVACDGVSRALDAISRSLRRTEVSAI